MVALPGASTADVAGRAERWGTVSHLSVASLTIAAGIAALFAIAWRFLTFTGFTNDHYVHLARAYQMLLGEWPVRDFVDPGMPLMYVVSAVARMAGGPALRTEWTVTAGAFAVAAACMTVAGARLSGSVVVGTLGSMLAVVINPRSFSYPKLLLYAVAALVILGAARNPTRLRVFALAVITVVAFLFRHDHGLYIGIGAAAAIVLAGRAHGWTIVVRRGGWFGAWVMALLAPWGMFVAAHGGLVEYVRSAIAFSRVEARYTMLRGWPALQFSGPVASRDNAVSWLFYLFHALPLLCLLLVVWRLRRGREAWTGEAAAVGALALMAIPLNLAFLRESLAVRVPDAVALAVLLGAWVLSLSMRGRGTWRAVRTIGAVAIVSVTTGAVFVAAEAREQLGRTDVWSGWRGVAERTADLTRRMNLPWPEGDHIPSRYSGDLMPFLTYLQRCTSPDDRLLMTGLFPEMYVLAERGFAGGQIAFMPGYYSGDDDQVRTIARLEAQSVPFVVLVRELEPGIRSEMPLIAAYVEARYEPLADIAVPETQGVRVYVEKGRPSARIDAVTGWPCFR